MFYLFGGECFLLGMTKTTQWLAFFLYYSEIKVLVKRKNDSPVNHLSFWVNEGMKTRLFLHVWFSKVLLLEINFSMKQRKKTTSKKTSWTAKQSQQKKKKQNACFVFAFLSKQVWEQQKSSTCFCFWNKQPRSCFVHKWESFFFLWTSHLPENKASNRQIVFFWTKPFCNEKEKPSKKKVVESMLYFSKITDLLFWHGFFNLSKTNI